MGPNNIIELPKLKRDITIQKKHGPDHLIGECHINFEKLMENILNINQNDGSAQKNLGKSI